MEIDRRELMLALIGGTAVSGVAAVGLQLSTGGDGDGGGSSTPTDAPASPATDTPASTPTDTPDPTTATPTRTATRTSDRSSEVGIGGWDTRSSDRGDVAVVGPRSLDFHVYKCNRALATTRIDATGTLRVAFDWTFRADGWYESSVVAVGTGDDRRPLEASSGIRTEPRTETEGTYVGTASVDGPVTLVLGLEPSGHCDNPDHGDTYFSVRNLSVSLA